MTNDREKLTPGQRRLWSQAELFRRLDASPRRLTPAEKLLREKRRAIQAVWVEKQLHAARTRQSPSQAGGWQLHTEWKAAHLAGRPQQVELPLDEPDKSERAVYATRQRADHYRHEQWLASLDKASTNL